MGYFDYPIDSKTLLRKKKKIHSVLLEKGSSFIEKKIAVLGGSTTDEVVDQLDLFLLNYGIKGVFYQSKYGKYMEDAMFGNEELDSFKPDIVYIHTNWRNITSFPTPMQSINEINQMLEAEYQRFVVIWETVEKRYGSSIIQNNFDRPNYRLLGNKDISDVHGRTNYISRLNQKLYEYSQTHQAFYINDLDFLASDYGYTAWSDPLYWYMYKYAMCLDAVPYVADSVAKIVKAIYGKNKKALALDLDNTIWGGVIGDDGVEGIAVGPEAPSGQVYSEFQEYCKELKDIGVILGIDSKNVEENAIAGLNHPDGVLRPIDFVSIKANWESKDQNLVKMAEELTLGVDSFVFVDDNPAEREIVRKQLPGVSVPEVGKVETFIRTLDHSGYFEVVSLSAEDSKKTEMYHTKAEAARAVAAFSDYGEYLDSLEMKATINPFEEIYISRIAQLTNKSNQFNLTTLRCSEDDIRKMMNSDHWISLYGRLEDRFGDNGIVTVVAGEIVEKELHIKLWLMSCRVLKRTMEDAMMDVLVEKAREYYVEKIIGYYYSTSKNGMVKCFYKDMDFSVIQDDGIKSVWSLNVYEYKNRNRHIEVKNDHGMYNSNI